MHYEWLHSHAIIHVQKINRRIIYHSKPSSVIQLHVQQTNHRIQIKVLTCLLQLLKMISSSVYKQAMISTPIQTVLFTEAYTPWVKKTRHQTLDHNFTNYYPIFKNFFTSRLGSKFATNSCLNIPPRFKHVATLPCETRMQKNGIILKYVLQLMMNHKVV